MTLFISFLLIYNFRMDWWWYGVAIAIWGAHFAFTRRKQLALSIAEQLGMSPRDLPREMPREMPREVPRDVPQDIPRNPSRDLPRGSGDK